MSPKVKPTPAIMIQGTGSNVGKSLLTAGLCRIFSRRGLAVRPFKPQNMSNNAAVTAEGGEIGRAQALQARACAISPSIHMNPVLLKPEAETGAQLVVQGRRVASYKAQDYAKLKPGLMAPVLESFARLGGDADLVIVEGAGSPAEINLREADIANMGFAEAADIPVVLVADIDRGGVIANLVGTRHVLAPSECGRVKGFIINKFRGDPALFEAGNRSIAERTGWSPLGVVPWFAAAARLPSEDSLDLDSKGTKARHGIKIAVPVLGRIANFDDLDPLAMEEDVSLVLVRPGEPLPADADLVILAGSKSTIGDLAMFRREGWDIDLLAHVRRGGFVLGICGGLQMLGRRLADPAGIEGPSGEVAGLALLDLETEMTGDKQLKNVEGVDSLAGARISGYEMHMGTCRGPALTRPFLRLRDPSGEGRPEGAISEDGRIFATHVHGLFTQDEFRSGFLAKLKARRARPFNYEAGIDATLDALADHLTACMDIDTISKIAGVQDDK